jgi:hypothetical protein
MGFISCGISGFLQWHEDEGTADEPSWFTGGWPMFWTP